MDFHFSSSILSPRGSAPPPRPPLPPCRWLRETILEGQWEGEGEREGEEGKEAGRDGEGEGADHPSARVTVVTAARFVLLMESLIT